MIVAAWPVLKFATMRKTERIPKYAAILYAASTTATLILMMVLVIHTRYVFSNPETDQNLQDLAKGLDGNFGAELKKALLVMDAVMKSPDFSSKVHEDSPRPCTTIQPFATPNVMPNLLTNNKLRLAEYPYFLRVFGYDSNGSEQVKWTIDQTLPPALRVCGKSYFEGVIKNELWQLSSEGPSGFRFRVDPIYSRLTSEYLAVITQPVPRELAGEHSVLRVSLMTTPMLSLIRPVLPPDYGFAVIDSSGKVLFHSDLARNGRENFFDETRGQELRTAVIAAHARTLDVTYLGDKHRMFVTPITSVQHSGWYLITFSNLEILAAQRVETMVLFSALAAIYFICLIICTTAVLLLLSLWKRHVVFWPDKKNIGCYIHIFFTIMVVTVLCCWIIFASDPRESLIYGLAIPFGSMFLAVLKVSGRSRPILWVSIFSAACVLVYFFARLAVRGPWETFSPLVLICGAFFLLAQDAISARIGHWANRLFLENDNLLLAVAFSMAYFCVLVLMSVPPCIAAFKAAHDYEETVSTQREQLLVMSNLEKRENLVVRRYCKVKFSDVEQETCSADLARWLFIRRRLEEQDLDVYGNVFRDQKRGQLFEPESPGRNDGRSGSAPPEQPDFLVRLAATLMPRTDSVTRELSQPSSTSRWEWTPEGVDRIRIQRSSAPATESASRQALARLYANDSGFLTQSLAYDLATLKAGEFIKATGVFIVATLVLMLASVWSTLRRMFLLSKNFAVLGEPYPEISIEDALQNLSDGAAPPEDRPNRILLTFPCSGKTDQLTRLTDAGKAIYIDLTSGRQAARQKLQVGGTGPIVLDHFETVMNEGVISKWVLELLEALLNQGKKIIIISTVDPRYRAGAVDDNEEPVLEAPSQDLARAERVLGRFKRMRVQGETIRHNDSCYHFLWTSCAWDEKVALYGIANDGWANHKNFSALLHLYKRGLIKREPNFVLAFPHFRHYLLRAISRGEQRSLELKDTTGLWDGLRIMFYVILIGMAAAVLFFNQHEILGYITTGVSAILPAARLLSQVRGGKASSTKGDSAEA